MGKGVGEKIWKYLYEIHDKKWLFQYFENNFGNYLIKASSQKFLDNKKCVLYEMWHVGAHDDFGIGIKNSKYLIFFLIFQEYNFECLHLENYQKPKCKIDIKTVWWLDKKFQSCSPFRWKKNFNILYLCPFITWDKQTIITLIYYV